MSEEEPAWRADLDAAVYRYLYTVEGGTIRYLTDRLMEVVAPHILAAERRGQDVFTQALAGEKELTDLHATNWLSACRELTEMTKNFEGVVERTRREAAAEIRLHKDEARGAVQAARVVDFCANLIDPDKENSADGTP
jgi:uncharacterized protein YigA (DUF484 family)